MKRKRERLEEPGEELYGLWIDGAGGRTQPRRFTQEAMPYSDACRELRTHIAILKKDMKAGQKLPYVAPWKT